MRIISPCAQSLQLGLWFKKNSYGFVIDFIFRTVTGSKDIHLALNLIKKEKAKEGGKARLIKGGRQGKHSLVLFEHQQVGENDPIPRIKTLCSQPRQYQEVGGKVKR